MNLKNPLENTYDLIVVGSGIAGTLLINRIHESFPNIKKVLIDQNSSIGGKARSISWQNQQWPPYPHVIGSKLYKFILNTLASSPKRESSILEEKDFINSLGLISGNKLHSLQIDDFFNDKCVKLIGGNSLSNSWKNHMKDIFSKEDDKDEKALKSFTQVPKKGPEANILDTFSLSLGIASYKDANLKILKQRLLYYKSLIQCEHLETLLLALSPNTQNSNNLKFAFSEKILRTSLEDNIWKIKSNKRTLSCKHLIVAHSPWELNSWLDRQHIPNKVLNLALKTKPCSLVSLTVETENSLDHLPHKFLVISESIEVIRNDKYLSLYSVIDFEMSMDTISVAKTIKRLKRALKKIDLIQEGTILPPLKEHIALHPFAWAQPSNHSSYNLIKKMEHYDYFNDKIAFCGESYGSSYDLDQNIITSILAASKWYNSMIG